MPKYIACITRMLLNAHRVFMSACPGEPSLHDTHCANCHYWIENQPEESEGNEDSRENDILEDGEEDV